MHSVLFLPASLSFSESTRSSVATLSFEFPDNTKFRGEAAAAVGSLNMAANNADEEFGGRSGYTRFRSRFGADVMSLQKRCTGLNEMLGSKITGARVKMFCLRVALSASP